MPGSILFALQLGRPLSRGKHSRSVQVALFLPSGANIETRVVQNSVSPDQLRRHLKFLEKLIT